MESSHASCWHYDLTVCECRHLRIFVTGVPAHPRGRPRVPAAPFPREPARCQHALPADCQCQHCCRGCRRCQHSARLAAGLAGTLRLLDCVAGTFPEGASAVPARTAGCLSVPALLQTGSRRCQHSARLAAGLAGTLRLLDCVAGTPG